MTPEGKVKKNVKKILDEYGCYYFNPATGGFGASGVPDIIACYKGRFIGIECKAGNNQPTLLQGANLDKIRAQGGIALVIREDNLEQVRDKLQALKELG